MAYYSRSSWTTVANAAPSIKYDQVHTTIHYPGFGNSSLKTANWTKEQSFKQIRAWRSMHVPKSYKEIAYNYFVLSTGDFVEGRGFRQNGANGTGSANRVGLSIQILIGDNEELNAKFLKGLADCLAHIKARYPNAVKRIYGHQHWVSTSCPGKAIMAAIKNGTINGNMKGSVSVSSGGTSVPKPSKPSVSKPAASTSSKLKVDGRFGTETVKEIQRRLGVKVDGRAGKDTWTALQRKKGMKIVDGIISKQSYKATELGNGIVSGKYWNYTGRGSSGSNLIKAIQKDLGVSQDGILYTGTIKALQKKLNNDPKYLK